MKMLVLQDIEKGQACSVFLTLDDIFAIIKYPFSYLELNCIAKQNLIKNSLIEFTGNLDCEELSTKELPGTVRILKHELTLEELIVSQNL